ncbi:MAG TPA: alpha/beta fold hydrolase [Clostridia bacterium]|nr:alpha/beta fold hydrolase [Clostridia bacterium]
MEKVFVPYEFFTEKLGNYCCIDVRENSRAVVLVIHGMMEHSDRYGHLRKSLLDNGFGYAALDLPGHGKSITNEKPAGYWPKKGFEQCREEIGELISDIKSTYRLPVILFGHSMGSFLSKGIISKYGSQLSGCILSGTNDRQPALLLAAGRTISSLITGIKGEAHYSKMLHDMAFGNYNKRINPVRTSNDWLTTDEAEVDKYNKDPLCGFNCTVAFYKDFTTWLSKIYDRDNLSVIPDNLPIYIFSGGDDPVGNYGKGVASFRNRLYSLGKRKILLRLYEGKRHECLNERNREEVLGHINEFCNEVLAERI